MNPPLPGRRATDRGPDVLTIDAAKVLRWVLAVVLTPLAAWAFSTYDKSKVDTSRFVADSANSLAKDVWRDSVLIRVDRRTRAMYCAGKPAGCE